MFTKIDILQIIKDHFSTLTKNDQLSLSDIVIFYALPFLISIFTYIRQVHLDNNSISTLVTVGSLFTGLLLSLLVLVYDQRTKIADDHSDKATKIKSALFQLYSNISYSILVSILLVCMSFSQQIFSEPSLINSVLNATLIGLSIHLALTIIMVLKRINITLTSRF